MPGGALAPVVAMCVTDPTDFMDTFMRKHGPDVTWDDESNGQMIKESVWAFLQHLHITLLATVRTAGFRSLVMPTLAIGGIGMSPASVCHAVACAARQDFIDHPGDPIVVRVACFQESHYSFMEHAKATSIAEFYT